VRKIPGSSSLQNFNACFHCGVGEPGNEVNPIIFPSNCSSTDTAFGEMYIVVPP